MELVTTNLNLRNPIDSGSASFYILVETSGSNAEHDAEKLNEFLETAMNNGTVTDGVVATDSFKIASMWATRERLAEACLRDGYTYKYDISLPHKVFYDAVNVIKDHLKGTDYKEVIGYGHVGDGNLHLNVTSTQYDPVIADRLEPFIFEWTARFKGSVSAEHGLGFKKRNCGAYTKSAGAIEEMKKIKYLFDPKGILNPYKVFPDP